MTQIISRAACRAFGPIVVPAGALPLASRRGVHMSVKLDISPYRGRSIPISMNTLAAMTGSCKRSIHHLIDAGVLERCDEHSDDWYNFVLFDIDRDLADYFDAWVERVPAPRIHAEFQHYRRMRRLCFVWAGAAHSPKILEAVFQKLKEIGNFTRHEVHGLIPLDPSTFKTISAWLNARFGTYARQRHAVSDDIPVTWEMFAAALPEEFRNLPKTYLDGRRPYQRERPSLRIRHRVWRLSELFNAGSLYAIVYAARLRRPEQMTSAMIVISRVEEIMRTHAPGQEWTMRTYQEALTRYAVDCDILPDDVAAVRDYTVRFWRIIVGRLRRYCLQHDPSGKRV
ncbi:hypothetical protein [Sphingomonas faeni]|uniref:hypothetical protein n=1 Tax=Sphingomonas faeni TaxID=185950 RepID=UPI00335838CC